MKNRQLDKSRLFANLTSNRDFLTFQGMVKNKGDEERNAKSEKARWKIHASLNFRLRSFAVKQCLKVQKIYR